MNEKIKGAFKSTKKAIVKYSPEILTGLGIASMIGSTIFAIKATPKAMNLLSVAQRDKEKKLLASDELMNSEYPIKLTFKEGFMTIWKEYIPAVSLCTSGIVMIILGSHINNRRSAALATAYAVSERTLRTYKDKVIEVIGENKEKKIRDQIAQDNINKDLPKNETIIITSKGNTLIKDEYSGRYFRSDLDTIRKAMNDLNREMLCENYISLNQFYSTIGLEPVKDGYRLGWNIDRGYIDINFGTCLANDEPCICLEFNRMPEPNFD